jgi:hypothetical protein
VADICKHDWFFVNGTDDLKCKRCGEVTGPRTYEERVQDMLQDVTTMGSAWSKDGERIDPTSVYAPMPEYTSLTSSPTTTSPFTATMKAAGKQVGKFDFNGPEMIFEGDAAESAKVFIECVANAFHGRLEQERKSELDACCDLLEGMHAATDGNHNYYLHAANELRKLRNIK